MAQPTATAVKVPHEKIAMRAYEKWMKRGCKHGHDRQDWIEAEAELRAEMGRMGPTATAQPSAAHTPTAHSATRR
jgi:hypothetical protein